MGKLVNENLCALFIDVAVSGQKSLPKEPDKILAVNRRLVGCINKSRLSSEQKKNYILLIFQLCGSDNNKFAECINNDDTGLISDCVAVYDPRTGTDRYNPCMVFT